MLHKTTAREVTCQCRRCRDVFDVVIIDRRGELDLEPTSAAQIVYSRPRKIYHRPGHCGGECQVLWGNTEPLFGDWPEYDPLREMTRVS